MTAQKLISEVMTQSPETISPEANLNEARDMMRSLRLRHLPVVRGGSVIGILSHRDLHFTLAMEHRPDTGIPVENALSPEPYIVTPDTPLKEVTERMAEERIGCTLVCDKGELLGVFTSVDACRVLASLL